MFQGSCVIYYIALHLYLNIFISSFYRSTFFGRGGEGRGGWRRVFVEVTKYFRHILTGHEIFSKVFDGSQNIFLCSILVFLFFKFRVLEHKISKLAIKPLRTFKKNMLNKSHHSADIWLIVGKIKKCLLHFDPDARVFVLSNWHKIQLCDIFFVSNLYLFDSIFSIIVWNNRWHNFDERICFPDNCCYDNG